jgi:xanthine dehydrogenase YagS FAD-binding subunit
MLPGFAYIRPASLKEAVRRLGSEGARVHAGGTDLLGCLRDKVFGAERVVSLGALKSLRGIGRKGETLRIGALTTITEVERDPIIRKSYAALAQGAAEVASPQLRHQGTIGGNLCQKPRCWYYRGEFDCLRKGGRLCFAFKGENQFHCILGGRNCYIVHPSDTAPALIAFDAYGRIAGPGGKRTVPVESFHVPPDENPQRETVLEQDEIVTHIVIPSSSTAARSSYRKVRARRSWDFAVAGVALAIEFDGERVGKGRVVLSGAAPVPWRSRGAESELTGKILDRDTASRAAAAAMADARPLEHNRYKVALFRGMIEEELLRLAAQEL